MGSYQAHLSIVWGVFKSGSLFISIFPCGHAFKKLFNLSPEMKPEKFFPDLRIAFIWTILTSKQETNVPYLLTYVWINISE